MRWIEALVQWRLPPTGLLAIRCFPLNASCRSLQSTLIARAMVPARCRLPRSGSVLVRVRCQNRQPGANPYRTVEDRGVGSAKVKPSCATCGTARLQGGIFMPSTAVTTT